VFNPLKKRGGKERLFLQNMKLLANKLVCDLRKKNELNESDGIHQYDPICLTAG
jgi:hypothetical protein